MNLSEMNTLQQLLYYYRENAGYVFEQFTRHFLISIYGVLFAAIVAIPLGFWIARHRKLALLSILMLGLGLGSDTVIATVFLYSLLPIIKNTYTGVRNVDAALLDTGKGMGMTRMQLTYLVELPLSLSVIMAGLRNALVVAIGITAIGTFIGAGGLGDIISRGVNATNGTAIILAGAIPTALMAVLADWLLGLMEKRLDPSSKVKRKR